MSGGFPLGMELCNAQAVGANTATSAGTLVTPSVTANTKGSYTQLVASTSSDCVWMVVVLDTTAQQQVGSITSFSNTTAVDIAVGGSGSEVVIVNNLITATFSYASVNAYAFPISIPAGTRIAARCQSDNNPNTGYVYVSLYLFDGAFTQMEGAAGVDALGFSSGTTRGTLMTASSSTNTKGSYVQLISSTARDYMGVFIGVDPGLDYNSGPVEDLVDIAIGGSGSEVVILPNLAHAIAGYDATNADRGFIGPPSSFIPISIPMGTRVAARMQSSTASTYFDITLYGVYQ